MAGVTLLTVVDLPEAFIATVVFGGSTLTGTGTGTVVLRIAGQLFVMLTQHDQAQKQLLLICEKQEQLFVMLRGYLLSVVTVVVARWRLMHSLSLER